MIKKLEKHTRNNILNIPGWRTKRKFLVIESDDWGSIRMPSREVYDELLKKSYHPYRDPYIKYDSMATSEDLESLFSVLRSFYDSQGRPLAFTTNIVLKNPDFERIRKENFQNYYSELFTETMKRYPGCEQSFSLWKGAFEEGLFRPQYHGREHLNVHNWMLSLQEKNPMMLEAFDYGMISISSMITRGDFNYMEALDFFSEEEKESKYALVTEGLALFEEVFGFPSSTFIANCYIWGSYLEEVLAKNGIKCLKGMANQIEPVLEDGQRIYRYVKHFTGTKNRFGMHYLIRNAFFEPSLAENENEVDECLRRINIAFRWNKPAVICSHRLNYIGSIHPENRENNLEALRELITRIKKRWPEVEFVSSDQLCAIMGNGQ